jgi:HSP20 family protein
MRVTDLIPWKSTRGSEPAARSERDAVAALQNDVNRAFADFPDCPMPLSPLPAGPARFDNSGVRATSPKPTRSRSRRVPGVDLADIASGERRDAGHPR